MSEGLRIAFIVGLCLHFLSNFFLKAFCIKYIFFYLNILRKFKKQKKKKKKKSNKKKKKEKKRRKKQSKAKQNSISEIRYYYYCGLLYSPWLLYSYFSAAVLSGLLQVPFVVLGSFLRIQNLTLYLNYGRRLLSFRRLCLVGVILHSVTFCFLSSLFKTEIRD